RATRHHLGRGDRAVRSELALDDNVASGREHVGLGLTGSYDTKRGGIGLYDGFHYGSAGSVNVGNRRNFKFEGKRIRVPCDIARLDAAGDTNRLPAKLALARGHFGHSQVVLGGGTNRAEDEVTNREDDQAAADKESWPYFHFLTGRALAIFNEVDRLRYISMCCGWFLAISRR